MKLEEAKEILKSILSYMEDDETEKEAIETVLQALDNSISKDKVKEKVEEYRNKSEEYDENRKNDFMGFWNIEFLKVCHKMQGLQELLEDK